MKILILSDLHLNTTSISNDYSFIKLKRTFNNNITDKDYDLVLIAGDVFETSIKNFTQINPFDILNTLFDGKDVVFCLGNHEFAHDDYENTIKYWTNMSKNNKFKNITCLDIKGKYTKKDLRIVGNVLWYDFSLLKNNLIQKGEIVDGWLDSTITNFDPIKENEKCVKQIKKNLKNWNKKTILLTHMVPHIDLNRFSINEPESIYNAYSGVDNLFDKLNFKFDYAICGHTHKREIKTINDINCINLGNDYFFRTNKIENLIIEI